MTPKRIQRKRTKGYRMPKGAIYVGRGSKWGSPFTASDCRAAGYQGTDAEIANRCVEAMIVANNLRSAHGESQAYPEEQFNTEAAAIEDHANQMRLLAERVEVQP